MFIDEIQMLHENGESVRALHRAAGVKAEAELVSLKQQLKLLNSECPRYEVYNVYTVLRPVLVEGDNPVALKRNAAALEKRDQLIRLARKAPLGAPWFSFCLEHRANEHQRAAYLVRWETQHKAYVCTVMFDSLRVRGMVEFLPNAFQVLLDEDDSIKSSVFDPELRGDNLRCAEAGVELVRTCVELLNWDRDDVPAQTLENSRGQRRSNEAVVKKSAPTIIKFEPFLKAVMAGTHRSSSDGRSAPGQHLVRGHYQNFKFTNPRFGHQPVLGKTYGRLWVKPHKRGNPERGFAEAPRAVVTLNGIESTYQPLTLVG